MEASGFSTTLASKLFVMLQSSNILVGPPLQFAPSTMNVKTALWSVVSLGTYIILQGDAKTLNCRNKKIHF